MVTRIGPRPLPDAMLCKAKREEVKATQYYDILILIFPLMILTLSVPGIGLGGQATHEKLWLRKYSQPARHKNRALWLKYNGFTGT